MSYKSFEELSSDPIIAAVKETFTEAKWDHELWGKSGYMILLKQTGNTTLIRTAGADFKIQAPLKSIIAWGQASELWDTKGGKLVINNNADSENWEAFEDLLNKKNVKYTAE